VTANIAFSLGAAVVSVAIVVLAGIKGDWWVAGVYGALAAGFLARARFGRRAREEDEDGSGGPVHEERRLPSARFRRR
jgi:hypothetical protein